MHARSVFLTYFLSFCIALKDFKAWDIFTEQRCVSDVCASLSVFWKHLLVREWSIAHSDHMAGTHTDTWCMQSQTHTSIVPYCSCNSLLLGDDCTVTAVSSSCNDRHLKRVWCMNQHLVNSYIFRRVLVCSAPGVGWSSTQPLVKLTPS